jgi:Cof subfamily protein (haloacid dehalogenase superfamily)
LYSCELEKERIEAVIKYAQENSIHVNLYDDEKIYVDKANKWSDYYKKFAKDVEIVEVGNLLNFDFEKTPKMVLIDERDRLDLAVPHLKSVIDDDVNMFYSKKNFLEFTNRNATKGFALKFLADYWGIDRKNVMAIGDNYNDTSMIEYAGLGVCVANGEEEIKKTADYITLSNEEDGVAYVLNKFILDI